MTDTNEADKLLDNEQNNQEVKENPKEEPKKEEATGTTGGMMPNINIDVEKSGKSLKMAFFEFFAMYLFVMGICLTDFDYSKFILGMWIIICLWSNYSGGHLNPAVTMGMVIGNPDFDFVKVLLYWAFQFLGAWCGMMTAEAFLSDIKWFKIPEVESSWFRILFSEAFLTGTFVFLLIFQLDKHTRSSQSAALNMLVPVAWFYFICSIGTETTGGSFNPAVLLIINFHAFRIGKDPNALDGCGKLVAAQLGGAIIMAIFYRLFFRMYMEGLAEDGKLEEDEKPQPA